jgi:hypothetical protein
VNPKTTIGAVDRLVEQVMAVEPDRSARRVFWVTDNCSSHRGEKAELSARTICTFLRDLSARRRTTPIVLEELRSVCERPMIIRMTTSPAGSDALTIGSGISSNVPGT